MALTITREIRIPVGAPMDGRYGILRVGIAGPQSAETGYIVNVKTIDAIVHDVASSRIAGGASLGGSLALELWRNLSAHLPANTRLCGIEMCESPLVRYSISGRVDSMVNLTCQFEFSAAHRLHASSLSDDENRREFGKCLGLHGHNYVLDVTVGGIPDPATGEVCPMARFRQTVKEFVVDRFDHTCLNSDVSEFASLNPTVENLASVVWGLLDRRFAPAVLQRVRVYETSKIWSDVTRSPE